MEEKEKTNHCDDECCSCDESCSCDDEGCSCGESCSCDDEGCSCDEECFVEEKTNKKEKKHKKEKAEDKLNEALLIIKNLEEKILREKAEAINYRHRKDEEVSKMLKYANVDIIKEMLPIVDNFERAINMDNQNLEDEVSKFLSGFKMIYCNLVSILEKNEVKAIDGSNKTFDPSYHEAVLVEKAEGVEPGFVLEVLQKGYLYKDKIVRPAMVKVSE